MPGQLEALLAVFHGRDVFMQMHTGGGKSLCMYIVPLAFVGDAMGIVVSPLIGLMEQQVSILTSMDRILNLCIYTHSCRIWGVSHALVSVATKPL